MELIHSGIYFYMKQKPFPKLYRERFLLFLSVGGAARYFFAKRKNSDTNACVCITPRQDIAIQSGVVFSISTYFTICIIRKKLYNSLHISNKLCFPCCGTDFHHTCVSVEKHSTSEVLSCFLSNNSYSVCREDFLYSSNVSFTDVEHS